MTRFVLMVSLLLASAGSVFANMELRISPAMFGKPQELMMTMGDMTMKPVTITIYSAEVKNKNNGTVEVMISYDMMNDKMRADMPMGEMQFTVMTRGEGIFTFMENMPAMKMNRTSKRMMPKKMFMITKGMMNMDMTVTAVKVMMMDEKMMK